MAYIGKEPADSFISFVKQDFSVSATTSYTLNNAVTNQNEIALFINHVRQEPTTAYTASGTSLTLTSATASGDDMYCIYLGQAKQTVNPADGSVGTTQLAADAVTEAKIADTAIENEHLNVNVITGQTAETSIATDDTILIHDTSASALRKMTRANFVAGVGGDNTPAFARDGGGGNTSIASKNTWTLVTLGTGIVDTDSDYDTSTGKFTPTTAGKYLIYSMVNIYSDGQLRTVTPAIYRNGSEFSPFRATSWTGDQTEYYITSSAITTIMDFNGSSDYIQLYVNVNWGGSGSVYLNSRPSFGAFKLIGV